MRWQTAVPNASEINTSAAQLLDALELVRPLSEQHMNRSTLGRWIIQSGADGTIADDTVTWLHHLLLPVNAPTAPRPKYRRPNRFHQTAA